MGENAQPDGFDPKFFVKGFRRRARAQLTINARLFNTVEGQPLTFSDMGGCIRITDEKGDTAEITKGDVMQSNGVIQVVNGVLQPK